MSIILKPSALKVKDDNGNYIGMNIFAAESTQEYLDAIETIGTQTQTAISTASTQAQAAMEAKAEQTIESIPEDYTELAGDVSAIKAELLQMQNDIEVNKTSSTQYFSFDFLVNHTYTLHNGSGSALNAYTRTSPDASGTNIETIGTSIPNDSTVIFSPTINAQYALLYGTGSGLVSVTDISVGIPKLQYEVNDLQEKSVNYVQKDGVGEVTERNTTFFEQSDNLFNKDTVKDNYDIRQNGSGLYEASGYMATEEYIDVSEYNSIKPLSWSGSAVIATTIRYVLYDSNKVALNQRTNTNAEIDTSNATYLRFGASLGAKNSLMVVPGNITPTAYIPYGFAFRYDSEATIEINPSDDIIQKIIDNKGKNIHFNSGTYDIIQQYKNHFGNDYFDNYTDYTSGGNNLGRGLPVYNGTKMTFSKGAVFVANYEGNNVNVKNNFSAFALESDVTIDGLSINTSGIRNCIHDDFDNNVAGTTVIKNCHFTSDSNIIAGGLGIHDIVEIENCYFDRTNDTVGFDFSYHNNSASDAQSMVIIKDNYMKHGVSIRWYGASTLLTDVLISNNSMANAIDYHEENSSATIENINLKYWNNEIRT